LHEVGSPVVCSAEVGLAGRGCTRGRRPRGRLSACRRARCATRRWRAGRSGRLGGS